MVIATAKTPSLKASSLPLSKVAGGGCQQPPDARVAEEPEPVQVGGGGAGDGEGREVAPDAAMGAQDAQELVRVLNGCFDLRVVADHPGVTFDLRDVSRLQGGDLARVEAVERVPDAVPFALDGPPADAGLEHDAGQVLEEERRIVGCVIAELLERRGERVRGGRVARPGPDRRAPWRPRPPGWRSTARCRVPGTGCRRCRRGRPARIRR